MSTLLPPGRSSSFGVLQAQLRSAVENARHGVMPFGDAGVDGCLPGGGLPLGRLHEVLAEGIEAETGAAAAGFLACLLGRLAGLRTVFWISAAVDLHAPGLLAYGLDPGQVILVQSGGDAATLAAMETALRAGAVAVVGEVSRLDRIASRRLQMACGRHGATGFALRRWPWGRPASRDREATASTTRWRIAPAKTAGEPPGVERWFGSAPGTAPSPARWEVSLTHARGGTEGAWIMEVTTDAAAGTSPAHPLRVVAQLADAAAATPRGRLTLAG